MSNGFSKGLERLRIAQVIGGLWEGRLSAIAANAHLVVNVSNVSFCRRWLYPKITPNTPYFLVKTAHAR